MVILLSVTVLSLICSVAIIFVFVAVGFILSGLRNATIEKTGQWLIWLTFVGVIHHELSHLLLAFLTGAKIESVVLFRVKPKNGNIGEVTFRPRGSKWVQALQVVLSSVAPMLLGFWSIWVLTMVLMPNAVGIHMGVYAYLTFSIFMNMALSKQDIKNIFSKFGWLLLVLFIMFFIVFSVFKDEVLSNSIVTSLFSWIGSELGS